MNQKQTDQVNEEKLEIGERYRQKEEKFEKLRDFQQIQVKFYQLFATVMR